MGRVKKRGPGPSSLLVTPDRAGNVVGIDPKEVEIGMRVEVAWDDVTPEFSLPKFRPIQK